MDRMTSMKDIAESFRLAMESKNEFKVIGLGIYKPGVKDFIEAAERKSGYPTW